MSPYGSVSQSPVDAILDGVEVSGVVAGNESMVSGLVTRQVFRRSVTKQPNRVWLA